MGTKLLTFLFLLLGNICHNVIHIVRHNVALFPLLTHSNAETYLFGLFLRAIRKQKEVNEEATIRLSVP